MAGRLVKPLALTALLTLSERCWAASSIQTAAYWAVMGIVVVAIIAAIAVAWRLVDLLRLRQQVGHQHVTETNTELEPVGLNESSIIQLVEAVQFPDGVVVYAVRIGERVVLLARYRETVTSAGDFPAAWLGDTATAAGTVYRPVAVGEASERSRRPRAERLARDEEEWQKQRDMLIRMLQENS
ncbi:MAG: hypothetical protein H5T86_00265 [Armatimonadetes bacterium]|nr:hypothetical protein [Armatimonadota bacterium]